MDGGGAEGVFLQIMTELVNQGDVVDLLLIQKKGPLLSKIPQEVNVIELGGSRYPFSIAALFSFFRLIKYINKTNARNLLSTLTGMNLFLIFASYFFRQRPHIALREAVTWDNYKSKIKKVLVKNFYSKADSIICVSEEVRQDLVRALGNENKLQVINNPVQKNVVRLKANDSFTHPWIEDKNLKVVAAMGRLCQQKGFDILLKAIAKFDSSDNVRLFILGDGELKDDLLKLASDLGLEDRVEFLGFQLNPYKIISRVDLFVLSSRWEGFVNSLLEVIALGIPVVSTDCKGGPKQILKNGEYGSLVPVDNVCAMYDSIKNRLYNDSQSKAPDSFFQDYLISSISDRYRAVFKSKS